MLYFIRNKIRIPNPYLISLRFLGNEIIGQGKQVLSVVNAKRILRLVNKQHLFQNENANINALQVLHKISPNRRIFFKTLSELHNKGQLQLNMAKITGENYAFLHPLGYYAKRVDASNKDFSVYQATKIVNKNKDKMPLEGSNVKQKTIFFEKSIKNLRKDMDVFFDNASKGIIDMPTLEKWLNHLETRSPIISLTDNEKIINKKLEILFADRQKSVENVTFTVIDAFAKYKEKTNLNEIFLTKQITHCYTEEDFTKKIERLASAKTLLENTENLTIPDMFLLAHNCNILDINETGHLKLSREVYNAIYNKENIFDVNYLSNKPDVNYIMNTIKEKNYFVREGSYNTIKGEVIPVALNIHKTIAIPYKTGCVYVQMITSTKSVSKNSVFLGYQETNEDPKKMFKEEYAFCFPYFTYQKSTTLLLDLRMQGFIQGNNFQGKMCMIKFIIF